MIISEMMAPMMKKRMMMMKDNDDDDNDDDDEEEESTGCVEKQEGTLPAHILSRERASLDTPGTRKGVGNHRSSMMMTPMLMMMTMTMKFSGTLDTSSCFAPLLRGDIPS